MNFWNIPEIGKDGNDVGRVSGPNQWEKVCAFLNPTFYLFFFFVFIISGHHQRRSNRDE